jgi:hypothetical protein
MNLRNIQTDLKNEMIDIWYHEISHCGHILFVFYFIKRSGQIKAKYH